MESALNYSEKSDFEEKSEVLAVMTARLAKHGLANDFTEAHVLEIGGSGGVLGGLLSTKVRRIIVTDVVDTQLVYNGEFPKLLNEKFLRNGYELALGQIEFQVVDAMQLPYRDGLFDFVVSLNAFEHIPDPIVALREAVRVTKKGGVIYLTFDPVWTADSGSHFAHLVPEPWAHLTLDTDAFCAQMTLAGGENSIEEFLHGMNRKPASYYRDGFPDALDVLNVHSHFLQYWSGCVRKEFVKHPNRAKAAERLGCSAEDLLIRGFCVMIQK
jgi:ubiquinone/menaquinone biosynthesis C-methylase UbiE